MKKILLGLLGAILLLVLAGFALPRHVTGSASVEINASPHTLTLLTSSMRQFNRWSPWAEKDPETRYTYSGPYAGVGSAMTWSSNARDVGNGAQKVTAVQPGKSVTVDVSFDGQGGLIARHSFEPLATSTRHSWSFDVDTGNNPLMRWMGLYMKGMILKDYDRGLAKLKALAEAAPKTSFEGFEASFTQEAAVTLAAVAHETPIAANQIGAALAKDFAAIGAELARQKLAMAGAPRAVFEPVGEPGKPDSRYKLTAQIPVPSNFVATAKIQRTQMPASEALRVVYRGPYENMAPSYDNAFAYLETLGLKAGTAYEDYIDDPVGKDPKTVRTDIVIPVQY